MQTEIKVECFKAILILKATRWLYLLAVAAGINQLHTQKPLKSNMLIVCCAYNVIWWVLVEK